MLKVSPYTLAWSKETQQYILWESRDRSSLNIAPDSPAWFVWLDHVSSFAFWGQTGHYAAHKEPRQRGGDCYWYAYLSLGDNRSKTYLGKTSGLSLARLEQVAQLLQARTTGRHISSKELKSSSEGATGLQLLRPLAIMNTAAHVQVETVRPAELQQHSELLLSTKLYVPRLRQQFVARSHLIERLSQAMEHALILISAPPGFGKTTLLAQWLAQTSLPVAWLSLDAQDNDPNSFLRYVIAALQRLDTHIGATALALLNVPQPIPAETVLARLINDVVSRELRDFALVLDDYHLIEAEPIHRGIIFLLKHLPPQMHLVLSTRSDPPLPLARLRARGQLSELRAAQLRFDTAEVKAFVSGVIGLDLADEDIVALQSRTEGWVAGLQFAALSLRQHGDVAGFVAGFTGSNHLVLDYLCQEVLSQQSAEVQSFLLRTCILERLSGPLCDAIRGSDGSQAMLEALERANVFMVSLDDERGWYRYHHLFAEVLLNCLQQTQPGLLPELHRRASIWYQQQGLVLEAVQHMLAASDLERAADLIEQHALTVAGWGRVHTVLGWLKGLPDVLVRTRPNLCTIHASMLLITHQLEAAEARLWDAERCLEVDMPVEQVCTIQAQVAVIRGYIACYFGDFADGVAFSHQALILLPEAETIWRKIATLCTAHAYLVSGDVTPVSECLIVAALVPVRTLGNLCLLLRSLILQAWLQGLQGQLRQAASTYQQVVQAIGGQEVFPFLCNGPAYYFGLGDLLCEWNDLDAAEQHLAQGMHLMQGTLVVDADVVMQGYTALARLHQARGDYSKALATLNTFMQLAGQRHFLPRLVACGLAIRTQVELASGNLAAASQWAEQCGLSLEDEELGYRREREYLTLVRVYIAQARALLTKDSSRAQTVLAQVLLLLERLREQAESNARMNSVIEVLILQALALQAQGEDTGALAALERVLVLAEPEGYMRLFLDEGKPLVALLQRASAHGIAASYVLSLVTASGEQISTHQQATHSEPLLEPLTQREREVLGLLMQGASNRQMARDLVLSVGTIKKYVYIICSKLGVQSRTQAVIKARMLNLLMQ